MHLSGHTGPGFAEILTDHTDLVLFTGTIRSSFLTSISLLLRRGERKIMTSAQYLTV